MLVITAPGQGAQAPGFLAPWLELPGVAEQLGEMSELAGCDLVRYGTKADADEIRDTAVAQPLLVAAGIVAASTLACGQYGGHGAGQRGGRGAGPRLFGAAAGHSVGELTAGAVAGALSAGDAMRLVGVRGRAMAAAAAVTPTGMTAVLGGDEAVVLAAIEAHGLTPANVNGTGQIVAAGTMAQLAAFAADPPAGARLRPLSVAGAFHTRHMAPAVAALREAAAGVAIADPAIPLLSNKDGAVITSGPEWLDRIVGQVAAPVRWDACTATMTALGVSAIIELPPAGTLTGLAKRALRAVSQRAVNQRSQDPGVTLLALNTPDQLDEARQIMATEEDSHDHLPEWRLIVAPTAGTFRSEQSGADAAVTPAGATVGTTTELGVVEARADRRTLLSPWPGVILEWLVEDGDPVSEGQPLARLQPQPSGAEGANGKPSGAEGANGKQGS